MRPDPMQHVAYVTTRRLLLDKIHKHGLPTLGLDRPSDQKWGRYSGHFKMSYWCLKPENDLALLPCNQLP
jgi:hypothetical protein